MEPILPGFLYVVPVPIADHTHANVLPLYTQQIVQSIEYFIVEHLKAARKYVKLVGHPKPLPAIHFTQMNKHRIDEQDIVIAMQPLHQGKDVAILSEAGCPGIADPGSALVAYAHKHHIHTVPLVGPCSLLLALMASGFNGQSFAFHGYLPISPLVRQEAIKKLENKVVQIGQTQIFMETPYRNQQLLENLLKACHPYTLLCIGSHLTASDGWVCTLSIQAWRKQVPNLHKVPTVFLLGR